MLPGWLLQITIFVVAVLAPCFCALHEVLQKDVAMQCHWLLYFVAYGVLRCVLGLLDPLLAAIWSVMPVDLYLEIKLALYVMLVLPRFGLLDFAAKSAEDAYSHYGRCAVENLQQKAGMLRERVMTTFQNKH